MKALELTVTGNVQRVGYRNIVSQAAFELGIKGYAENLPDESVRIVVQGNERKIREFTNKIRIRKWPINVENIKKRNIEIKTPFKNFAILRGKPTQEMAERADEAALYMHKMYGEMHDMNTEMRGMHNEMKGTNTEMRGMHNEMKGTNAEMRGMHNEMHGLRGEMHGFREETSQNFKTLNLKTDSLIGETRSLRKETSGNFKLLGDKTDKFRKETSDNFKGLDTKYGSVSNTLKDISGSITQNNKLLAQIVKRFNVS